MFNPKPLIIDFNIAFEKAARFCAYQERCHRDIERRLQEWNVDIDIQDEIMAELIQQNFLNEERFALAFVSGKVNIKRWGKNKITYELRSRNISDYIINKAIGQIDEEQYLLNLKTLIQLKNSLIIAKNDFEKRMKLIKYLASRGYETSLINDNLD